MCIRDRPCPDLKERVLWDSSHVFHEYRRKKTYSILTWHCDLRSSKRVSYTSSPPPLLLERKHAFTLALVLGLLHLMLQEKISQTEPDSVNIRLVRWIRWMRNHNMQPFQVHPSASSQIAGHCMGKKEQGIFPPTVQGQYWALVFTKPEDNCSTTFRNFMKI